MNSYELSSPSAALAVIAVAIAAITVGATVVLPAQLASYDADPYTRAAAMAAAEAPSDADINRARGEMPESDVRDERGDSACVIRETGPFRAERRESRIRSAGNHGPG